MRASYLASFAIFLFACTSGGGYYLPKNHDGGVEPKGDLSMMAGPGDMAQMTAASCENGKQDGEESDIDCGGNCPKCQVEQHCHGSSDCASMNCQTGSCAPGANCGDGIQNQGESDVDCGGPCAQCADFQRCFNNSDCQSLMCSAGTCNAAPSCFDGIKNGTETDVDCGGNNCSSCSDGLACKKSADCLDANCSQLLCCAQSFGNCDAFSGNGCESSLLSDSNNCGGCGHVCPQNTPSCSNGVCVAQAQCAVATEVAYNGHCYYLDGNGGKCDPGYMLASQGVFVNIGTAFAGKTYKHVNSDNCCIKNADAVENYGMAGHCNAPGPFDPGDVALGGAGCNGVTNLNPNQLTLCMK